MKSAWEKGSFAFLGTSAKERRTKALMPENIRIDARELPELLAFCAHAAQLIRFFNKNNEAEGTWGIFMEKDPTVILALLMENHPEKWDAKVREIIGAFYTTEGEEKKVICSRLAVTLADMIILLNQWYENATGLLKWGVTSPVTAVLSKAIQSETGKSVQKFGKLLESLQNDNLLSSFQKKQVQLSRIHADWNLWGETLKPVKQPIKKKSYVAQNSKKTEETLKTAVETMRQIFQQLYFPMVYLNERAPQWFYDSLEQKKEHSPHIGLLLSFLQLFTHAKDELNTIPRRHLHHYYFDLLRQEMKPAVPDRTIVCFQLAEHVEEYTVLAGTHLLAGINEHGLESHYTTAHDLSLTQVQIAALYTQYIGKSAMMKTGSSFKLVSGIYAGSERSALNTGQMNYQGWAVFGEEQLDKSVQEQQMTDANIGFVIASPVLALKEGERQVDLRFQFTTESFSNLFLLIDDIRENTGDSHDEVVTRLFANSMQIVASGTSGWFPVQWKTDAFKDWQNSASITISLTLSGDDPAITDNVPGTLGDTFDTSLPLIRILLNPDSNVYLYSIVHGLELENLTIEVNVKGLKSLTLMNDIGLLDNSKPFLPFGPMPSKNAYLLIGSAELFRKRLSKLVFNAEWSNLPEAKEGFAAYYKNYPGAIDNYSFGVQLSALSHAAFRPTEKEQRQPFRLFNADGPDTTLKTWTEFKDINLNKLQIQPDYLLKSVPEFSNSLHTGYFKLQLEKPSMAFGHVEYPRLFSNALIAQSQSGKGLFGWKRSNQEQSVPAEPYVPVINKIVANYTASTIINFHSFKADDNEVNSGEKVYIISPFGKQEVYGNGRASDRVLFPMYDADGYLYIGLRQVKPGRQVSLYFDIRESRARVRDKQMEVQWAFLRSNMWERFMPENLVSDFTRDFTTSGIIRILIPEDIKTDQTILPSGILWIRAAAKGNLAIAGRVVGVYINAVEVTWENNGDQTHFDRHLTLPLIKELAVQRAEIASVVQPVGFDGGRPADHFDQFYIRTSERLRHKNRGINTWDIEHLVLEYFPNVRRVKCVTWMEYPALEPGVVKVVVMPATTGDEVEPMFGFHQLDEIYDFLKARVTPFAAIEVINPVYEKIKVSCDICLQPGLEKDQGLYLQQLHQTILFFICPWLKEGNIQLGGSINKNDVLLLLKKEPFVRFLTRFSIIHIFEQEDAYYEFVDTAKNTSLNILHSQFPWSIIIPVNQHSITFITEQTHQIPDGNSIEDMRLSTDFILLGDDNDIAVQSNLQQPPPRPPGKEWFLFSK